MNKTLNKMNDKYSLKFNQSTFETMKRSLGLPEEALAIDVFHHIITTKSVTTKRQIMEMFGYDKEEYQKIFYEDAPYAPRVIRTDGVAIFITRHPIDMLACCPRKLKDYQQTFRELLLRILIWGNFKDGVKELCELLVQEDPCKVIPNYNLLEKSREITEAQLMRALRLYNSSCPI